MCQGPIDTPLFLHVQYLGQHLFQSQGLSNSHCFCRKNILSMFVLKFVYNFNLLTFVLYEICGFGDCVKGVQELNVG